MSPTGRTILRCLAQVLTVFAVAFASVAVLVALAVPEVRP
jgi:hypothetical protein